MSKKASYKQALARPTAKGGRGWKYADDQSMNAACSQMLGLTLCMNPQNIFEWAKRHNIILQPLMRELQLLDGPLLVCVLNDWDLETARKKLAEANAS